MSVVTFSSFDPSTTLSACFRSPSSGLWPPLSVFRAYRWLAVDEYGRVWGRLGPWDDKQTCQITVAVSGISLHGRLTERYACVAHEREDKGVERSVKGLAHDCS